MKTIGLIAARFQLGMILTVAACAFTAPTSAGVIAYNFSGGIQAGGGGGPYGFEFTPVTDLVIDSVGYYDYQSDGLAVGHDVSIWSIGGSLLQSTSVTTANSSLAGPVVNDGQFRYTSIPDLAVSAGSTYVIVAAATGDLDTWWINGTHITNPPGLITIGANRFGGGGTSFPDSTGPTIYHHISLTARAQSVPVPGTLAVLGLGLAGIGYQRRKQLKAA